MSALFRALGLRAASKPAAKTESKEDATPAPATELDIDNIFERVYACGRPSVRPTDITDHRNNIDELAAHLDKSLGEHYLVVNLSNKNRNLIDYGKFHNAVIEFQPFSRSDLADDTPAMGQIFRICYALSFWMAWGPETRLVLHCNTGVFRTGFILACYMVYSGTCATVQQGLNMFCEARKIPPDAMSKMLPSWRYLMNQMDSFMRGAPSLPKVWRLNYIIINAPGLSMPGDQEFPAVQVFEGPRMVFDSTKDATENDTIRWEDGKLILDVGQLICGDYQVWVLTPPRERGVSGVITTKPLATTKIRKHAARFAFHSSMLEQGVNQFNAGEVDIWRANIDKNAFSMCLLTEEVSVDEVVKSNTDKAVKRSYINLRGPPAIVKGAEEYSAHVYVFPDAKLLKQLVGSEGFDETAAVCALQRANNNIGKTREYLQAAIMREHFREPAALRDLRLLRDTLSMEEVAAAFFARGNVGRKKKGIGLDELDVSGLLEAAKVGNLTAAGGGGPGTGGGGGKGRRKKGKKKGKHDDSSDSSSDDSDDPLKHASDESEDDDVDVFTSGAGGGGADSSVPKLFANDAAAKDEDEDDEEEEIVEEEEDGGPWLMKEHPIFGAWYKMLADGKSKAEVLEVLAKDQFNPALLDVGANAPVPEDMPASTIPIKDWDFLQKYFKMMKVGLPRPVVEHKMLSESCNPALLDADESSLVMAGNLSPPKKKKNKGPQIVRKKLHWVPIRGKVEGTIWSGPPADLIAAAAQLIDNEKEFERLFIQKPEDLKKKKKKEDKGSVVQLLDGKRAMNAGIALAKLKMSFHSVVECLQRMTCRNGKKVLSVTEIHNLVTLCPTDEEIKLVKGYHGDTNKLAQAEKFMLAVADVPMARQRAEGLFFQAGFDERVKESHARIRLFTEAVNQIRSASRLHRFLKAVLVLGNKMNGVTEKNRKQLVKAFTVNSLHQLHLTKAFDQQTSVLQYLIKLLKRKDPDLLKLSKDFKGTTLAEAKRLPLDVMNEEMRELRGGLTALEAVVREAAQNGEGWASMTAGGGNGPTYIEEEVEEPKEDKKSSGSASGGAGGDAEPAAPGEDPPAANGAGVEEAPKKKKKIRRRVEPLPEFASIAQSELTKLEETFNAAQTAYRDLVKFWKEDGDMSADELFGNLHMFLQTFDSTLNAMIEKKRKEKDAKRRAKEMKKTKARAARKRAIEAGEEVSDDEEESSESEESEASTDFDDGDADTSNQKASWNNTGTAAAVDDDDDEEEEVAKPAVAKADPKAALLAAIGARKPKGDDGDGGSKPSASADPRAGLLGAIKQRGAAAESKAASTATTAADPRSALMAAIQAKEKKEEDAPKDTGWVMGSTDDKDPEADGRNALLNAIRLKRKE